MSLRKATFLSNYPKTPCIMVMLCLSESSCFEKRRTEARKCQRKVKTIGNDRFTSAVFDSFVVAQAISTPQNMISQGIC